MTGQPRREAIIGQLKSAAIEPVLERFGRGRTAGVNIVVTLRGPEPRTVVMGAHYDRGGVGRGAVDNGASCAALIELVAAFKSAPLERSTLQVVFFDREEVGLLGSRAFFAAGHRVDYAVNMDIFAYGESMFATASRPDGVLLRSLRAAAREADLPVRDVPPESYPSSDHLTMIAAGVETLGIALADTADIDGVLAMDPARLTFGRGPRILRIIHSANDTIKEIRPEQMARGIGVVEQMIRAFDRAQ